MDEHTGNSGLTGQKLLYDPLFDKKPDIEIHDDPTKGVWGKAKVKKAIFIISLVVFVSISLLFSFNSVSKDKYKYEEIESGWLLSAYNGSDTDTVLSVDYVTDGSGVKDETKGVTEVRRFAICCNEYLEFIFVSDKVDIIDPTSFYYCRALKAVVVDENNPNYMSVDGVLYKKENGVATELMLYPMQNGYYRSALKAGLAGPESPDDIETFFSEYTKQEEKIKEEYATTGVTYDILPTVTKIGQLSFSTCEEMKNISIPDGVTEIETMAFFKCGALESVYLPDGLTAIGSDAFSSCKTLSYIYIPASVTEIGHHAFNNCISATAVYMGAPDGSGIELGSQWAPQVRKVFMTQVDIYYGQEREVQ